MYIKNNYTYMSTIENFIIISNQNDVVHHCL